MQCSRAQAREQAVLARQYGVQSGIVRQHRKHNLSVSSGRSGRLRQGSAGIHEGSSLVDGAIPNRNIMPGTHQIGGDRRAHIAKADESDLHCVLSGKCGDELLEYF
jgi:hypothetical protein